MWDHVNLNVIDLLLQQNSIKKKNQKQKTQLQLAKQEKLETIEYAGC